MEDLQITPLLRQADLSAFYDSFYKVSWVLEWRLVMLLDWWSQKHKRWFEKLVVKLIQFRLFCLVVYIHHKHLHNMPPVFEGIIYFCSHVKVKNFMVEQMEGYRSNPRMRRNDCKFNHSCWESKFLREKLFGCWFTKDDFLIFLSIVQISLSFSH